MGAPNTVNESGQAFNNFQKRYREAQKAKQEAKRQKKIQEKHKKQTIAY